MSHLLTKPSNEERLDKFFGHYSETTRKLFKEFHAQNPHIYAEFKKLAITMKKTGRKRYSSKMIINVLRWEHDLKTTDTEFKINDRFQSLYGRLLAYHHPEFEEFFEFRVRGHG